MGIDAATDVARARSERITVRDAATTESVAALQTMETAAAALESAAASIRVAQASSEDTGANGSQHANGDLGDYDWTSSPGTNPEVLSHLGSAGTAKGLDSSLSAIGGIGEETARYGRDGLKHGEMGSAGVLVETGIGAALGHLAGLADESLGRRNGEQLATQENHTFPGETTGVGTGLDHLWLLGDTEYYRATYDEDMDGFDPFAGLSQSRTHIVAMPPHLVGAGVTDEDTAVGITLGVTLVHPTIEQISKVVIAPPPSGTIIDWNHQLPGLVEVDPSGKITITGSQAEIESILASVTVLPPHDFSGQLTLGIDVTVSGPGTATSHLDYPITVIPVADTPVVTGDERTTLEDQPVALPSLAGHLTDVDGSEVLSFEIRGVPAGASFQSGHVSPTDPTVWIFSPAEIAAGVTFVPATNAFGDVTMTIRAIATEQANGDSAYVDAPVTVHIIPQDGPHVAITAAATDEDTPVAIGTHINAFVVDPDGSETIVSATIANVPAGSTVTITPTPGVRLVPNDPTDPTGYTIEADPTFTGTPSELQDAVKSALASLTLTPPKDSDADFQLLVTVNSHDTDGSSYDKTVALPVTVHAVADAPEVSGSGTGNEDTFIAVPIIVAPADKDGSETLDYVEISGVPAGATVQWHNTDGSTNTSGTVTVLPDGTLRITGTTAEIEARAAALQIKTAVDTDDDYTLSVKVGSVESNPTETGDVTVLHNSTTFNVPVTVAPVADPVTIAGSSTVVEDHAVNFGADVTLTKADQNSSGTSGPSSETITTVVIHDVPSDAAVTYAAVAGVVVTPNDPTHPTSFTVTADPAYAGPALTPAQLEQAVLDTVKSFTLTPPANSDVDITLKLDVTTVDRLGAPDESSPLTTSDLPFMIAVKADADPATLTPVAGLNAGNEDQPIDVGFTVGRTDTDGSEAVQSVVIRDIPNGFTLSTTSATNGTLLTKNVDGSYTVTGPNLADPTANDAAINDVVQHLVLTPVANGPRTNEDDDFTLHVDVTTKENNLSGGQVETPTNTQTFSLPVTVAPIADAVAIGSTSTVVEDHSVNFGAAIESGLVKADQNSSGTSGPSSETVTQIVISAIPESGAQSIAAIAYPGDGTTAAQNHVTVTYDAIAGTLTLALQAGGSEQDLRDALKAVSLTPHHNSDVDIPLTVTATTIDRWGTPEASSPLDTTLTHTIVVTADAEGDEPTIIGSATTTEDNSAALPVTVTLQDTDGSETLSHVDISGLPHGAAITWTGLPAGATATAIKNAGGDTVGWSFAPASSAYGDTQALQSFLNTKLIVSPPQDSDVDFDLTVKAYNVESNLSGNGGSTAATPFGQGTIHVTVTPVLDTVTLPATYSTVNEDQWQKTNEDGSNPTLDAPSVAFGTTIEQAIVRSGDTGAFDPADTTEGVAKIVLTGLPAGTVAWSDPAATDPVRVVMSEDAATHIQTFTIEANPAYTGATLSSAALEAQIRATLDTFKFTPAADDSTDVSVAVQVYSRDTDPDSATDSIGPTLTASATHTIVVNARADAPTVTGDTVTTDEDTSVALNLDAALRDHVGSSEHLSVVISDVPSGASLTFGGSATVASVTDASTGITTYTLTGTEAAIHASLASTTFVPTPQWSGTVNMTIAATATEVGADDPNAYVEPTGDDRITVSAPIKVTITPVVDDLTMANTSTVVQENGGSSSPTDPTLTINLGQRLGLTMDDLDGSQSLDLTLTGIRSDFTAAFGTSITGVTTDTSVAGTVKISGAHVQDVLTVLNSLALTSSSDSDADFTVHIAGSTNENALGSSPAHSVSFDHAVIVQAVADTPAVDVGATTKAFVNEDSDWVTYPVTVALNDTDGSESLQSVVVTWSTSGSGTQPSLQFGTTSGVTFDYGTGTVTLTGSTADIAATMQTLQVKPGANNDADITVTVKATSVESNPSETNSNGPGAAGDEIALPTASTQQSFVIPVTAVPDIPTMTVSSIGVSSSGRGLEDQDIPLAFSVAHADSTDGSESIKSVTIANVPAGFVLTSSSANGTLSYDASSGVYTVTGATDAAINDALANLTLQISPTGSTGARYNLDTDFNLSVTVTTIENHASETGANQGANSEASKTFNVNVPVNAVADGVTETGSSVIVEDIAKTIGTDIQWTLKDADGSENVTKVEVSNFAIGSTVTWTEASGPHSMTIAAASDTITFTAAHTTDGSDPIRALVDTLEVKAPTNSDTDMSLSVKITTTDNDSSTITQSATLGVTVQAVADTPSVAVSNISVNEDAAAIPLVIHPARSSDQDGSETLSVLVSLPGGSSPLQSLTPVSIHDATHDLTVTTAGNVSTVTGSVGGNAITPITITDNGNGTYLVASAAVTDAATSTSGEASLDAVLGSGVLTLNVLSQWSGSLTGINGIKVDAISTEAASGGQLAPASYGGADGTSKTESATQYIDVTVAPIVDDLTMANTSTVVQENGGSSSPTDPTLTINLGQRLGLTMDDLDGSQSLDLTLTGIRSDFTATFGTSITGVTTDTSVAGTVKISGAHVQDVLTVLNSLALTSSSDSDADFTVHIAGSTNENALDASFAHSVSFDHKVVVQAVADQPGVDVGATTKTGVDEDSDWVTYPVTVALNDTDGSESLQSVKVEYSTIGAGLQPSIQFGTTTGITFANVSGAVTLTGTTADIEAALKTLQLKPGANNGEDITVKVTATSVESNPSETSSNGPGAVGDEIAVPTATTVATFTIPVVPVPEVPSLTAPTSASGTEDVATAINGFTVTTATQDTDGSETNYIDFNTDAFPPGILFMMADGTIVGQQVVDATGEWLRIPTSALDASGGLKILTPHDWSGAIDLQVRGVVVDHSTSESYDVTTVTATKTMTLTVAPAADKALPGDASVGNEDTAINFGATIADLADADHSHGVHVEDVTKGYNASNDQGGTESISKIVLTVPADTASLTYAISNSASYGTATASYDAGTRTYTITSSIITGASDLGALTDAQRSTAEDDIRHLLATFSVQMGVTNTDQNGAIGVTATTLDVKNGTASTIDASYNHPVYVLAVADTPSISANYTVAGSENGTIPLVGTGSDAGKTIVAHLADTDGSESLSVEISGAPDGTLVAFDSGYTPTGGTTISKVGSTYVISGGSESDINTALTHLTFTPVDFAGSTTLTVTAVATEAGQAGDPDPFGNGAGIAVKTATAIGSITLNVVPSVDTPIVKGVASGLEDQLIPVPINVKLTDTDQVNGTETYTMRIANDLPTTTVAGVPYSTRLYGAGGAEITLDADNTYHLTAADVAVLKVLPPLNYSSALQGDITLHTTTIVTDTASTGVDTKSFTTDIPIHVTGVADVPNDYPVTVAAIEDNPIALGHSLIQAAGGTLANALTDADGSEKLSIVIDGLPTTVIPTVSSGRLDYIGNGKWSVSADSLADLNTAVESLTLPARSNFSGDDPYAGIKVYAVSQEIDSSQAISAAWPVTIEVSPALDPNIGIDGLASWNPGVVLSEDQTTGGLTTGISLASAANKVYIDNDGSERVFKYDFDLTNMFNASDAAHNAGIDGKCELLYGNAAAWSTLSAADKAQWFIDNYASGTFSSHTTDASVALGHIVVTESQLNAGSQLVDVVLGAGLSVAQSPFMDSNVDFSIPVTAMIRDSATINGTPITVEAPQSTSFAVTIVGVADTPTTFANNPDKDSNTANIDVFGVVQPIPLDMGGHSNDTDVSLGRTLSETVYYILSLDSATTATGSVDKPAVVLLDSSNNPVGLDNGDGTFLIRSSDVTVDPTTGKLTDKSGGQLTIESPWFSGPQTTLNFSLTTVAQEKDSNPISTASSSATFSVIVDPSGGSAGIMPEPPTIDLTHVLVGQEDTSSSLASTGFVSAGANTASVSVMFTLPSGVTLTNAIFNPVTGRWVASMDDVNSGAVKIQAPPDYAGTLDIPIEAVATSTSLMKASTSAILHVPITPVADGPSFTASPDAGYEDTPVSLHIALGASPTGNPADAGEVDRDGSETLSGTAYVKLTDGATLVGSYAVVGAADADANAGGANLVGYYRVPVADLPGLQAQAAANWNGTFGVTVAGVTTDALTYVDPSNGSTVNASSTQAGSYSFSVGVAAVADPPALTVPDTAHTPTGNEDTSISITGLSAALVDTVTTNGAEILSVKISGVPDGTKFNVGSNNGDGSWTIPVDQLATLSVTPPANYSGTMHLVLEAYSIETSNGDVAHSTRGFDVIVTPVADGLAMLDKDLTLTSGGIVSLDMSVSLRDQNGLTDAAGNPVNPGETSPELVSITFTSVPTGLLLVPASGGEVRDLGSGSWTFVGTQGQANALALASGPGTIAGTYTVKTSAVSIDGSSTSSAVADDFVVKVVAPDHAGATYNGTTGNDTVDWSAHLGNDIMSGGNGNDTLIAGNGINIIIGGKGADTMTGGTNSDTYVWNAGDDVGSVDVITNFQSGVGKDHIDLSRLLTGFNQQTSNLDNFVHVKADGKTLQVDTTGSGSNFHDVVTLQNAVISQSQLHDLVKNGSLIV